MGFAPAMNRIRKMFESIAYAGMKPAGAPQGKRLAWLGPLAGPIIRFLDGGARPDDPFYLTNRTLGQKMRAVLVIAAPCLLVAGAIGLAAIGYFDSAAPKLPPAPTLTPEQVATKMLPNLDKDLKIYVNHDVEVMDVHVEKGSIMKVAGSARNTTDRAMLNTELIFDLTNDAGSRLGAVSTKVARIEPKSVAEFSFPVQQREAAFALVREIRMQ
jgi:hypothetical protein